MKPYKSRERAQVPIFDGHAHVGWGMEPEFLVQLMERYGIELALTSNLCTELDIVSNREMVEIEKRYPRLRGLAWCSPNKEGNDISDVEPFLRDGLLAGMKLHPSLHLYSVDDSLLVPYMELCQRYDLPAQFHTAPDEFCNPTLMLGLARRHPQVKIVMLHMNLGDKDRDNDAAIEAARRAPNLYLDTSWVPSEKVIKAVREIGYERVLFGTDAPVASFFKTGDHEHYDHYFLYNAIPLQQPPFIRTLQCQLSLVEYEHVMYLNAQRIYRL
jgi:predicted TIM-barrel fold metal-dependent hydrolase